MTQELTPEAIQHANQMLNFLASRSQSDYQGVMKKTLDEKELATNIANMEKKLKNFGLENPVGAIEGGTGVAKEESGLEGEDGQLAIQILKQEGRLQQCGRGRGKCLLLLSVEPLAAAQVVEATTAPAASETTPSGEVTPDGDGTGDADVELIDASNVTALTRAIRDNHRATNKRINELIRQNKMLEKQKVKYEEQLDSQIATISELEAQLEEAKVGSWQ